MKKKSIPATKVCVLLFILVLIVSLALMPSLTQRYVDYRGMSKTVYKAILVTFYACAAPALIALLSMLVLLVHIQRGERFSRSNTFLLSVISWCCICVVGASLTGAVWYAPLLFVSVAMMFIFLLVRVVRGCFLAALELKEENSLTI